MASDGPVHAVRIGRVKASVWANETERGPNHGVTFTRLYREGGEWKLSATFRREDLPVLAETACAVHRWIRGQALNAVDAEAGDQAAEAPPEPGASGAGR